MPICCVCKHAWHIQCLHSGQRPAANNDKDWKCPTCVTQARKASFVQCTWVPKGTTVQCGRDIQPKFGVTCVGCNLRFCGAHSKGRDTSAWRCNACDVKPKPLEVDCAYPHCSKEGGKVALKTAWRCNSCKGYFHVSHTDGKQRKDSVLGYNLSQTGPPPYSPDLNPIEHMWGLMVPIVDRLAPTTLDDLAAAIHIAWMEVPQEAYSRTTVLQCLGCKDYITTLYRSNVRRHLRNNCRALKSSPVSQVQHTKARDSLMRRCLRSHNFCQGSWMFFSSVDVFTRVAT
eukprot:PhM_4_TR3081/c1_g1_i2/m.53910